jgi:hypothetical protein
MKRKASPLSRQIASDVTILLSSFAAGLVVFALAICLQWLIYEDWMHRNGPLRIVGSVLAAVLTFVVALRWQSAIRDRKLEMLRRFETIKWMNDRIRNALQAIACVTYAADPSATDSVRNAVDVIEGVLQEVLIDARPGTSGPQEGSAAQRGPASQGELP